MGGTKVLGKEKRREKRVCLLLSQNLDRLSTQEEVVNIPQEILIPLIVSLVLAFVGHWVSVFMQRKANNHTLDLRSFDSMQKEIVDSRRDTDRERQRADALVGENLSLKSLNYRLDADLDRIRREKEALREEIEKLRGELSESKEEIFQLTAEVEWMKQKIIELAKTPPKP